MSPRRRWFRWVGVAALAGLGAPTASADPAPVPAVKAATTARGTEKGAATLKAPTAPSVTVVGVLTRAGDRVCAGYSEPARWANLRYELGFIPVVGPPTAEATLAEWIGRPVVAVGVADVPPPPAPPIEHSGPCPEEQMRSDYVAGPDGIRLRRSGLAGPRSVKPVTLRLYDYLTIQKDGETLAVTFRNDAGVALREVELVMHYEGCGGKPGSQVIRRPIGALAAGSVTSAVFPRLVLRDGVASRAGAHAAASVQVLAQGEGVVFVLDYSLHRAGVPVECPR